MQNKIFAKYWSLTFDEYKNICSYFNIEPDVKIYENVIVYIHKLSNKKYAKNSFYFYLSNIKKNNFNIIFLDFVTNYFFKDHSFRYVLKIILNFHECKNLDINFDNSKSLISFCFIFLKKFFQEIFLFIFFSFILLLKIIFFKLTKPNIMSKIKNKRFLISGGKGSLGREILEIILSFEFKEIYLLINNDLDIVNSKKIKKVQINLENFNDINIKNFDNKEKIIDIAILAHGFKENKGSNLNLDLIRKTYEINFFSNVKLVKILRKITKKIILISSLGRYHGMPDNSGYNSSKSALSIWAESLNLGSENNFLSVYEPGLFFSKMTKDKKSIFFTDVNYIGLDIINRNNQRVTYRYPYYFYILSRFLEACPFKMKKFIINLFGK